MTDYGKFCSAIDSLIAESSGRLPTIAKIDTELGTIIAVPLETDHTVWRVIEIAQQTMDFIERSACAILHDPILEDHRGLLHPLYRYLAMTLDTMTTLGYLGDCRQLLLQTESIKETLFNEERLLRRAWGLDNRIPLRVLNREAAEAGADDAVKDRTAFPPSYLGKAVDMSIVKRAVFSSQNRFVSGEWVVVRDEETFRLGRVTETIDSSCYIGGVWEPDSNDFMHILRRRVLVNLGVDRSCQLYSYGTIVKIGRLPKSLPVDIGAVAWKRIIRNLVAANSNKL